MPKKKLSPGAALVAQRWKKTTKAERVEAVEAAAAARRKPTPCPKCGVEQPTSRAARVHCQKKRAKKS